MEPYSENSPRFSVVHDPGEFPLATSMVITTTEVIYGLKYQSFYPGTILRDLKTGTTHVVRRRKGRMYLFPRVSDLA